MKPRICPKCGTPQQWEMWRQCLCGYDFGPPDEAAKPAGAPTTVVQTPPSVGRLCAALLFESIACALLLSFAAGLAGMFLVFASLCLPRPQEHRPVKATDWLIGLGIVAIFAVFVVALIRWRPEPRFLQHPVFAIALWTLLTTITYRRWRSQQRALLTHSHATMA